MRPARKARGGRIPGYVTDEQRRAPGCSAGRMYRLRRRDTSVSSAACAQPGGRRVANRRIARPDAPLAALATPESKRSTNRDIFTTIAPSYDTITVLLSYGQDRRWKDRLVDLACVQAGEVAVDLACGTGDLGFRLAGRGARVVGVDLTPRACSPARRSAT